MKPPQMLTHFSMIKKKEKHINKINGIKDAIHKKRFIIA